MSVFPKHIGVNDNVIIHIRLNNFSDICLPVKVDLYVENKNSSYLEWILENKEFLLPPLTCEEKGNATDRYFVFNMSDKKPLGRYDCILGIKYLDKREHSQTMENAFFNVEKISANRKSNGFISIKNKADVKTKIKIFYIDKKIDKSLNSYEEIKISQEGFLHIIYGNNKIIIC